MDTMLVAAYGRDIAKTTYDTLAASDINTYLKPGSQVSLKPNLVVPGPASNGAVTHPEVTEGVIQYLRDYGIEEIKIIESSWVGADTKEAFRYSGYTELSEKHGIPLIDLKDDRCTALSHGGYSIKVCNEATDTDFLINIPVLKAHCQTRLTCCMKNLKGCIPDSEKRRFHTLGIHKPVAVLNAMIKTGYCVVDGICGDLSFEEGGNPVYSGRIIAGRNPLTIDSYCAGLIGYSPDEISYLSYGRELGIGEYFRHGDPLVEVGAENKPLCTDARHQNIADKYRSLIDEREACSACYSALIYALHRIGGKLKNGDKVCIGQGFKGKTGCGGIGIGACARGCGTYVTGCPPTAADIIKGLNH